MNDINLPQWMPHRVALVLAMPPGETLKARQVYDNMKKLNWNGSYEHTRKLLTVNKSLVFKTKQGWALTALGLALKNMVFIDVQRARDLHVAIGPGVVIHLPPPATPLHREYELYDGKGPR